MSLTDWTMTVPAGLRAVWEFAYVTPGFPERRLELLGNRQVRFEDGEAHGFWELQDSVDLYITFHYLADPYKIRKHHFRRISQTDDFILNTDPKWFAVLCRRSPPVQAAD